PARSVPSHTSTPCRIVPLARRSPSGLQATPLKRVSGWSRSRRIWTQVPVAGSQSRIALSHPELASLLPSGLHSTPDTVQRWPRDNLSGAPLAVSQRLTTVSAPQLAR